MPRKSFLKQISLALAVIAASLAGSPVRAQEGTVVRVEPAAAQAQAGGLVNVAIKIDNVTNLTAFELHLSFDPNILEVVDVSNGGFVTADFVAQNVFDNAAGTIDYAIAQMNRAPVQGSGTLLNVNFRARRDGNSGIALRGTQAASNGLLLSDQNGISISATWMGGSVQVGSGATITPTSTTPSVSPTSSPTPTPSPTATPTSSLTATPATAPTSVTSTANACFSPTVCPTTVTPTFTFTPTPTASLVLQTANVRLDPSPISVNQNDTFNLFVKIDNAMDLSAFEIHLSFDAKTLEVTQLINGGFLTADIVEKNIFDNSAGTIDYAIAQNSRPASQGSGTLLTVAFRAKTAGSSNVNLRNAQNPSQGLLLSNANGMALPATWSAGSVTIKAVLTQERIHVVKFGEWLYCIGRAYGVSPWAIAETNGIRWWPYIIFPGQKLTIPNVPWVDSPSSGPVCQAQFSAPVLPVLSPTTIPVTVVPTTVVTAVPVTPPPISVVTVPSSACQAYYVVRRGDTLYRIGISFGVSYTEIARINGISNARLIYVGQTLCIP